MGNLYNSIYADDCALLAHIPEQLQQILDVYTWKREALDLKINIGKTQVMSTPRVVNEANIRPDVKPLTVVYLQNTVNEEVNLDGSGINAASRTFWKLQELLFENYNLSLTTKLAVVILTLLFGCES